MEWEKTKKERHALAFCFNPFQPNSTSQQLTPYDDFCQIRVIKNGPLQVLCVNSVPGTLLNPLHVSTKTFDYLLSETL